MFVQDHSRPWNVPTPMRPGRFEALDERHRGLNVEVDLGAIGAFGGAGRHSAVLWADQQRSLAQLPGRLGSGRAGFYEGFYLKGVGRTALAANWRSDDLAHSSGHLPASAAARERLVSLLLIERGLGHTIVPCEGLLLAPLAEGLVDPEGAGPPADACAQAISVKRGDFARPSQLLWWADRLLPDAICPEQSLGAFVATLAQGLLPPGATATGAEELDPEAVVGLMAAATARGLDHFADWFRAGVAWGSLFDNLTLDGRFLDLETPILSGGPFVGLLSTHAGPELPDAAPRARLLGACGLHWVRQMSAFAAAIARATADLTEEFSAIERDYGAALAEALRAAMREGRLADPVAALHRIQADIEAVFGPRPGIEALLARELREGTLLSTCRHRGAHRFVRADGMPAARLEPARRARYHALETGGSALFTDAALARGLDALLGDLDESSTLPALREALIALPAAVRALVNA